MRFISVRDLKLRTSQIWHQLKEEGEVVITSNGKPIGILSRIEEDNLEDYLKALRRARAIAALNKIQERSRQKGLDKLTEEEIEEEIKATRRERYQ
ncbi:Antitoxin Phd_YefM, type II toxin-antitoxin system [Thermanaeromonas toyohensis ToBE]|uniref:Antitoxin Phd_YefM, type II toxin-antitoxin system n=1 Tax=Thermanaeromonas toyohensis ToBE TaxID=698762 RepID=A0A1W1VDE3_9FIRM|nr:type II toxin-antitoxin system Phd/YefM family antitoxin [Thermanaeromonas toyohensis]SMB91335.1 Antitoxin Phd_YefM, type II toxin-antitoxin system [Thermanaeromonas toyohensis ToBE]